MGFMDIIPYTAPKSLTNDTTFSNYLLIVDAYSKIPKLYGTENITTAEVLEKLDMFQSRFGENGPIWLVVFRKDLSRCRYADYLDGVQKGMSTSRSLFNVSGNGTSRDERIS